VPQTQSITDLRDLLLAELMRQAEQNNARARNLLVLVVGLTLTCLFFQLLMVLIRRRVVQPLVQATDLVAGLVEGKLEQEIPGGAPSRRDCCHDARCGCSTAHAGATAWPASAKH
jgi:nitrate/nitrite-specific signal transduction histidine kinase